MATPTTPVLTAAAATDEDVRTAAHAFAQALAESAEFRAFEETTARLRRDESAQRAITAYQTKQQSLQMMLMLNAASVEEQAELECLRQAFLSEPTVAAYLKARADLMALCQAAADLLSRRIGLSFAAACGPGLC